jgi:hypothetical protein
VIKELQSIRRVFSLCKREWQLIKQSPFEFFKMPSVNNQRVRFLKEGQFEKILGCCPPWLKPIVTIARYTGRCGEATFSVLHGMRLTFKTGLLTLSIQKTARDLRSH